MVKKIIVHNSLENDSDIVMFIWNPDDKMKEAYGAEHNDYEYIRELLIEKNRNGPTGKMPILWHPKELKFYELNTRRAKEDYYDRTREA